MAEAAVAYVSLAISAKGAQKQIEEAIGGDKVGAQQGKVIGEGLTKSIDKMLKTGLVAVAGTAIAGLGTVLYKGFQRLSAIDTAEAKLRGLGYSAESIATIMDNALASVKGTAFGLGDAATVAAQAVAAGIKPGKDLEAVLKIVSNTAAAAGTGLGEMGSIFAKAMSQANGVQNDVISQLADRGIPIYQALADQLGVTAGEVFKLASKGKIGFDTFAAAATDAAGTVAFEMGSTFTGSFDNMLAAAGRLGEKLLGGIFPELKSGMQGMIVWLDGLGPAAERVGASIAGAVSDLWSGLMMDSAARDAAGSLEGLVAVGANLRAAFEVTAQAVASFVGWLQRNWDVVSAIAVAVGTLVAGLYAWVKVVQVAKAVQVLWNATVAANPIGAILLGITALIAGLVWFFTETELGRQVWANFVSFLGTAWNWLWTSVLSPVINAIGTAFTWLWTSVIQPIGAFIGAAIQVVGAIATWLWVNAIKPAVDGIAGTFTFLWGLIRPIFDLWVMSFKLTGAIVVWLWNNAVVPAAKGIGAIFQWVWGSVLQPVFGFIGTALQVAGLAFRVLYSTFVKPAFDAIANVFKWIWNSIIKPIFDAISKAVDAVGKAIGKAFQTAGDIIRGAFNGVVGFVKGIFNGIIDAVNGVIRGINGVAGTVGKALGVDLHISTIPRLANGALIEATPGRGSIVNVGEGRYDEMVLPLGGPQFARMAAALADAVGSRGSTGIRPGDRVVFEVEGEPFTAVAKRVVSSAVPSAEAVRSRFAG